ncbi:hypothetical protein BCR32DRAFT_326326 [Anaeromyces robustus]|uniref:Uncharacterized protein n=1 Tax=Anaeromyces robustus TaxID=1754192 RepID=A0A1Y1XCZ2_9FUNG|nr:hypothetical protein BCR32DRAFT_326326 [Anaeromyces robustus]|eukprot:ORX83593.1 hypothetical protein BCR32DRAFT_326326 [Anaeromyces robustus]
MSKNHLLFTKCCGNVDNLLMVYEKNYKITNNMVVKSYFTGGGNVLLKLSYDIIIFFLKYSRKYLRKLIS